MKFSIAAITILLTAAVSTYAQKTVSFVAPPFDSVVHAGQPFTVSLQFQDTITSVVVADLLFGKQSGGDPSNLNLGEAILKNVASPVFNQTGPQGQAFVKNVTLTLPVGTKGLVNITCGEFFTVGAGNSPSLRVAKTRVNVQ